MNQQNSIIQIILAEHPETEAIYLFGSYGTENEWPDSDIDIGVLLPVEMAKQIDGWDWMILAVHAYRQMDIDMVIKIIESGLDELLAFVDTIKALE